MVDDRKIDDIFRDVRAIVEPSFPMWSLVLHGNPTGIHVGAPAKATAAGMAELLRAAADFVDSRSPGTYERVIDTPIDN